MLYKLEEERKKELIEKLSSTKKSKNARFHYFNELANIYILEKEYLQTERIYQICEKEYQDTPLYLANIQLNFVNLYLEYLDKYEQAESCLKNVLNINLDSSHSNSVKEIVFIFLVYIKNLEIIGNAKLLNKSLSYEEIMLYFNANKRSDFDIQTVIKLNIKLTDIEILFAKKYIKNLSYQDAKSFLQLSTKRCENCLNLLKEHKTNIPDQYNNLSMKCLYSYATIMNTANYRSETTIDTYKRSLTIAEILKKENFQSNIYLNLSVIYFKNSDFQQARFCIQKAYNFDNLTNKNSNIIHYHRLILKDVIINLNTEFIKNKFALYLEEPIDNFFLKLEETRLFGILNLKSQENLSTNIEMQKFDSNYSNINIFLANQEYQNTANEIDNELYFIKQNIDEELIITKEYKTNLLLSLLDYALEKEQFEVAKTIYYICVKYDNSSIYIDMIKQKLTKFYIEDIQNKLKNNKSIDFIIYICDMLFTNNFNSSIALDVDNFIMLDFKNCITADMIYCNLLNILEKDSANTIPVNAILNVYQQFIIYFNKQVELMEIYSYKIKANMLIADIEEQIAIRYKGNSIEEFNNFLTNAINRFDLCLNLLIQNSYSSNSYYKEIINKKIKILYKLNNNSYPDEAIALALHLLEDLIQRQSEIDLAKKSKNIKDICIQAKAKQYYDIGYMYMNMVNKNFEKAELYFKKVIELNFKNFNINNSNFKNTLLKKNYLILLEQKLQQLNEELIANKLLIYKKDIEILLPKYQKAKLLSKLSTNEQLMIMLKKMKIKNLLNDKRLQKLDQKYNTKANLVINENYLKAINEIEEKKLFLSNY